MIDRICISINQRCNLQCSYCHFREKKSLPPSTMDVFQILDQVKEYAKGTFKIGFVGDGEPFLDFPLLQSYIEYVASHPNIISYTITNGTISLKPEQWNFLRDHKVTVGFSLDGPKNLHDPLRSDSYDRIMENLKEYRETVGEYPTFNATVGRETMGRKKEVIDFFQPFGSRVTFSRMIGKNGISLEEYEEFLTLAERKLSVRRGGTDCTMYGGQCGAGKNNFFFAQGNSYVCGNCVDLPPLAKSSLPFSELEGIWETGYEGQGCYKETRR